MNRVFKYSILLLTILSVFFVKHLSGAEWNLHSAMQKIEQNKEHFTANHSKEGNHWNELTSVNAEKTDISFEVDLESNEYTSVLGLGFYFALVILTTHYWTNNHVNKNRLLAQESKPKYILFHRLKLFS